MVLCTSQTISIPPQHKLFASNPNRLYPRASLQLQKTLISHKITGLRLRATTSEETSTSIIEYSEETSDVVKTVETAPVEEEPKEEPFVEEQVPVFEFLDNLDFKDMLTVTFKNQLNPEDTSSILIYGSSALVTLWLASAVIGAIDSIPVVPKALELVGLGYTIWFSSRYLILKKNRDELLSKVEEFKQQIMGSNDEQL